MARRGRRRVTMLAMWTAVLALAGADAASADPVSSWSGKNDRFAWEARRVGCGVVGETPSTIRAHTRWRASPARGYARLTFIRQIQDADSQAWTTVQRMRRSTRNTALEGNRGVIHWTQWFFPFSDEAGATSRHIVVVAWLRDRPGADRLADRRERVFRPCVVRG